MLVEINAGLGMGVWNGNSMAQYPLVSKSKFRLQGHRIILPKEGALTMRSMK